MDKNTTIAIVLSTVVIIGGFGLQSIIFPKTEVITPPVSTESPVVITNEAIGSEIKPDTSSIIITSKALTEEIAEQTVMIENDLVEVVFTNRGGDILSYRLKKHVDSDGPVQMAEYTTKDKRAFSVILGNEKGQLVDELFNIKKISENEIGFYKTLFIQNSDGSTSSFTLAKQYSFHPDDYLFELKITIDGDESFKGLSVNSAGYTLVSSPQIGPAWNAKNDRYEYRKFYNFINGKKKTATLKENETKLIESAVSWTGVAGKYFTLIAIPSFDVGKTIYSSFATANDIQNSQLLLVRNPIIGNRVTDTWKFYVGPRTDKNLSRYNIAGNNPWALNDLRLNEIVESSGILSPLEIALKWLMEMFYMFVPNWGVSIILMTILMRIIIFPLTKKSSEATLKMQEHAPKMQEIQKKYKESPQKMNEEMAKFYKESGYNPLSGCLPMVIQFPLIFAMYGLFNNYFEFRGAMFIPGWIPDLSIGDSVMTLPFTVPFLNWTELRILPFIYVVSQLFFGKVTQTPTTTQQNSSMKMMMYGMPIMFFFMFYNSPSGLLLYWTFTNILTLFQQIIINKMMHGKKNTGLKLVKK